LRLYSGIRVLCRRSSRMDTRAYDKRDLSIKQERRVDIRQTDVWLPKNWLLQLFLHPFPHPFRAPVF
jgi:hypothetical protein